MKGRPWSRGERTLLYATLVCPIAIGIGTYALQKLRSTHASTFVTANGPVVCIAWSPDSHEIAVGSRQGKSGTLSLYDDRGNGDLQQLVASSQSAIWMVSFSPDGRWLAGLSRSGVSVWGRGTSVPVRTISLIPSSRLEWKGGGRFLQVKGWSRFPGTLEEWQIEVATGKVIRGSSKGRGLELPVSEASPNGNFYLERRPLNPSAAGNGKATTPSPNLMVRVRRMSDGAILREQLDRNFTQLWWADGSHLAGLAAITNGGQLLEYRLWEFDCQSKQETWHPLDVKGFANVRLSLDKRWLAWTQPDRIRLFDLRKKTFVKEWDTAPAPISASEFSPDSRTLIWIDGNTVQVQRLDQIVLASSA